MLSPVWENMIRNFYYPFWVDPDKLELGIQEQFKDLRLLPAGPALEEWQEIADKAFLRRLFNQRALAVGAQQHIF